MISTMAPSKKALRSFAETLLVSCFWLLVWQGMSLLVGSELLLASPLSVLIRLGALSGTADFWLSILRSLLRILTGFVLANIAGILLGALTACSGFLDKLIRLPMNLIKATPVASFVILALVWLSGRNLSVFICFLVVLPLIWSSVDQGLRSVKKELTEVAKVYRLSFLKRLRAIYVPAVMPFYVSSFRIAIGYVFKSGVAGEVIARPRGTIGAHLYDAKVYLETPDLFAWTAVIILLSVLIEKGFSALWNRTERKWKGRVKGERNEA